MKRYSLKPVKENLQIITWFCEQVREVLELREGARANSDVRERSVLVGDLELWGYPTSSFGVQAAEFIPALAMCRRGAADPSLGKTRDDGSGSTGIYELVFDAATEQELFFAWMLPVGFAGGGAVEPVIRWAPADGTAGDVVWGLEYAWENMGSASANSTLVTVASAAQGAALQHQRCALPQLPGSGKAPGGILVGRVFRQAAAGADTYAAGAVLKGLVFNYVRRRLGVKMGG